MNDVDAAHQCIATLEEPEGALVLVVDSLGQVAVAAGFWEYSAYANIDSSEFMVEQGLLPGIILEHVTHPKGRVHGYIAVVQDGAAQANYYAGVGLTLS